MPYRFSVRLAAAGSLIVTAALLAVATASDSSATPSAASVQSQVAAGKSELAKGKFDSAITILSKAAAALGEAPGSCDCHYNLGKALCEKAKLEEQKEDERKAAARFQSAKLQLRIAMRVGRGNVISKRANEYMLANVPQTLLTPKLNVGTEALAMQTGEATTRGAAPVKAKVYEFYADWCDPCKQLKPLLEKIQREQSDKLDVKLIDVDDQSNQALVEQYDISPIPTVIYVDAGGKVVGYTIGFSGEENIRRQLRKLLG